MKKALVLVLSKDESPWAEIMDAALDTWAKIQINGVQELFYCDEYRRGKKNDKIIYISGCYSIDKISEKTQKAFKFALENYEFDYLIRPSTSTYIDKRQLINYIQNIPASIYEGLQANFMGKGNYAWGGGYIISRDLVELAVKNEWEWRLMDDVALGFLMTKLGVTINGNGRFITIHVKNGQYEFLPYQCSEEIKSLNDLPAEGQFMYRIKQDHDRRIDIKLMYELHERFEKYYEQNNYAR